MSRSARSELETGSLGAASSLMSAALSYFEAASELNPNDTKLMVRVTTALSQQVTLHAYCQLQVHGKKGMRLVSDEEQCTASCCEK